MSESRGRILWRRVLPALLLASLAVAVTGGLGWWQWERANEQAIPVLPGDPVPLDTVLTAGESPVGVIGTRVTVAGSWADADAALVSGREVDGEAAVLLVRALTVVDSSTGETATLPVVLGWRPADDPAPSAADLAPGDVELSGWLRASEAAQPIPDLPAEQIDGTFWTAAMSGAELAQVWPQPLYSAVFVSEQPSPTYDALPPPPPETSLDLRSLAYAGEWWIFGTFVVVITWRWLRDNGRERPANAESEPAEKPELVADAAGRH